MMKFIHFHLEENLSYLPWITYFTWYLHPFSTTDKFQAFNSIINLSRIFNFTKYIYIIKKTKDSQIIIAFDFFIQVHKKKRRKEKQSREQ